MSQAICNTFHWFNSNQHTDVKEVRVKERVKENGKTAPSFALFLAASEGLERLEKGTAHIKQGVIINYIFCFYDMPIITGTSSSLTIYKYLL